MMADGACDLGDVPHVRTWIITHLSPPVTIELCDDHFPPGLVGLLAADLGVEMPGLYTAIERFIGREAKKAAADLAAAQAAEQDQAQADEYEIKPPGSEAEIETYLQEQAEIDAAFAENEDSA